MTRAIATGGWTLLLLSTICGSTMLAQNPRLRGLDQQQAPDPAPAPQPAVSPQTQPASAPPQTAPSMLQQPAREAQIVIDNNNLSIRADNSSLAAILHQVAARSGMKIDGLGGDERVFGSFGPGAPRDVLADLLNGTAYNLVLLGDLSDGAPRELILTPATHGGSPVPSPAPQANAADEASNDQETVDVAPPPPPQPESPPPGTTPPTPGVRTPQQLFEQLQRMRQGQSQQPGQQPVQQDSPLQ